MFGNLLGNLLQLGCITFAPDSLEVIALVDYLRNSTESFEDLYCGSFRSEQEAKKFAMSSVEPERPTLAIVVVNHLDIEGGNVNLALFSVTDRSISEGNRSPREKLWHIHLGDSWISAKTQAECYHYLFDATLKLHQLGLDPADPKGGYLFGFFDTTIGNKKEARSYKEIYLTLGVDHPGCITFVTDVLAEAVAAKEAGLQAVLLLRPGNAPLPPDHGFRIVKSLLEL